MYLSIRPTDVDALVVLADSFCATQQYTEARFYYRKGLQCFKDLHQNDNRGTNQITRSSRSDVTATTSIVDDSAVIVRSSSTSLLSVILMQKASEQEGVEDTYGSRCNSSLMDNNTTMMGIRTMSNHRKGVKDNDDRKREMDIIEKLLKVAELPSCLDLDDQQRCLEELCCYDLRNASLR